MPVVWTFRHYVEEDGTSDVKKTYDDGSNQLRARFLSKIVILSSLPMAEWHETYWKPLQGNCSGLEELRFKADNVQQRPLGFRSGPNEFTILFWATKKSGDKFIPKSACKIALERKEIALRDRTRTHDIWLEL